MNKKLSSGIKMVLVCLTVSATFGFWQLNAFAGGTVSDASATGSTLSLTVEGKTDANVKAAVAVQVLDESENVLMMQSITVKGGSFSGIIDLTGLELTAGKTYKVQIADYDGGDWKTTEFTPTASATSDTKPTESTTVTTDQGSGSNSSDSVSSDNGSGSDDANVSSKDAAKTDAAKKASTKGTSKSVAKSEAKVEEIEPTKKEVKEEETPVLKEEENPAEEEKPEEKKRGKDKATDSVKTETKISEDKGGLPLWAKLGIGAAGVAAAGFAVYAIAKTLGAKKENE
ncbi:MAG: hypothetical protein K6A97_05710 [Lachnospiraceae bacterium]|nr:hypothetical protein [Lachnospiraceae bacterium]